VVKITLDLLTRIPQQPGKGSRPKKAEDKQSPAGKKHESEKRNSDSSNKLAKKRKVSAGGWPPTAEQLWVRDL
jgi:AF4/FMR2 family protein 1